MTESDSPRIFLFACIHNLARVKRLAAPRSEGPAGRSLRAIRDHIKQRVTTLVLDEGVAA